ncbi:MAG: preprotein translocase subunit SecY [bacterium]
MFQNFITKTVQIFKDPSLRRRILVVIGALALFRVLSTIPIPGINADKLAAFFDQSAAGDIFGLVSIVSGGGLSHLSIVMLGVGPYITGSIIMQLLTMIFPKLKAMYHEEGELGRAKFTQYSRILTVPLAIVQGFGYLMLLEKSGAVESLGVIGFIANIAMITAGSVLLMWMGELMTEFGIGNGTSMIIFAGIVAAIPTHLSQMVVNFTSSQIPMTILLAVAGVLIVLGVVIVTEAERPIPVTYAKRIRGNKVYGGVSTYLPLRVNQAGVIPIIFALSILLFPQMIFKFLATVPNHIVASVSDYIVGVLANGWFYSIFYFILVFLFTYFYTAVTFDPHAISENLQKNGAFIPGVRPGDSTSEYISKILTRITMVGAIFLGLVAVLPLAMKAITGISSIAIGGTALLIVVSVVLDLIKKVDAQLSMREY